MIDIIILGIILTAVGFASFYIYKAKKNGKSCIGCPYSRECGKNRCNCDLDEK